MKARNGKGASREGSPPSHSQQAEPRIESGVSLTHDSDHPGKFIRVVLADDQGLFRQGLTLLLKAQPDVAEVLAVETLADLASILPTFRPDVLLLDLVLERTCARRHPDARRRDARHRRDCQRRYRPECWRPSARARPEWSSSGRRSRR